MSKSKRVRVLVICGEPFNRTTATGITMTNLFQGWPPDKIAQLYSASMKQDTSTCSLAWKLSMSDQRIVGSLLELLPFLRPANLGEHDPSSVAGRGKPRTSSIATVVRNASVLLDLAPYRLPSNIRSAVDQFRPEVIYSLLGSSRMVRLVADLSSRYSIPVIPHFMDDWLATYTSSRPIPIITPLLRRRLEKMTAELLSRCQRGLGISDLMCEEYSRRFGIPFDCVMNPVELPPSRSAPREFGKPFRLVYVGGLHLGRADRLKDVVKSVNRLRLQSVSTELHVYAPDSDGRRFAEEVGGVEGCFVHPFIESSSVQEVLKKYSCALHVESFDDFYSNYTRLSVSTKIPQYLAAGLPVLAYSPASGASARYIFKNACGVVVGRAAANDLDSAILSLALDVISHSEYSLRARHLAEDRHDAKVVRSYFAHVLSGNSDAQEGGVA